MLSISMLLFFTCQLSIRIKPYVLGYFLQDLAPRDPPSLLTTGLVKEKECKGLWYRLNISGMAAFLRNNQ